MFVVWLLMSSLLMQSSRGERGGCFAHCILNFDNSDLQLRVANYFSYFSSKTYVVGTQKTRLDETVQTDGYEKNHN